MRIISRREPLGIAGDLSSPRGAEAPADGQVLIVVPAYNEEHSLPEVLAELRRDCPWADAVVVDDGSRDATREVARAHGYRVLSLPFNLGVGGAVQTGFQYAAARGYRAVVQVDADGQHPPAEVARLVDPVLRGECDVTVGSRFLERGSYRQTFLRALGIRLLARMISTLTGRRVTDPTSGFRAYGLDAARYVAADYPYDYPEPEALAALLRRGFRVREIEVRMRTRANGRSSIGPAVSVKYMFKVILAIAISMVRSDSARADVPREVRLP